MATLVEYLRLDRSGWRRLISETYQLWASREFARLEDAYTPLLEQGIVLDQKPLQLIHEIWKGHKRQGHKMQHLELEAKATTIQDTGTFTALAAAFGNRDRDGDVIVSGAFKATISAWEASGRRIPLLWSHSGRPEDHIGHISSMREVDAGLQVAGQPALEGSQVAREAWRAMKSGTVALSFGFLTTDSDKRADGVTELRAVDLYEISLTSAPSNPRTAILSMKSLAPIRVTSFEC